MRFFERGALPGYSREEDLINDPIQKRGGRKLLRASCCSLICERIDKQERWLVSGEARVGRATHSVCVSSCISPSLPTSAPYHRWKWGKQRDGSSSQTNQLSISTAIVIIQSSMEETLLNNSIIIRSILCNMLWIFDCPSRVDHSC